jgi:hypothetical protein
MLYSPAMLKTLLEKGRYLVVIAVHASGGVMEH